MLLVIFALIVFSGTEEIGMGLMRLLFISPLLLAPFYVVVALFLEQAGIKI